MRLDVDAVLRYIARRRGEAPRLRSFRRIEDTPLSPAGRTLGFAGWIYVSSNRGGVIAVDGFSRRWFIKASAVTLAALVQGRQRLAQGASRLLSSAATYTYGFEEGVAGQPVDIASPGVTATKGGPTYSAAAVKHGNLGVDVQRCQRVGRFGTRYRTRRPLPARCT